MKNEYLFLSDDHRVTVSEYKPDGITVEISDIKDTPLWVIAFSLSNKNEDSAKKLSEVHSTLTQYSPLVLSCESSEYYNKILFPLVNALERKLRKLLYLAASISNNEKAKESIKQLEEKDFGKIFELLFIDQNFILEMKKRINAEANSEFNGKSKYSKEEIKAYLDSLAEHTLWDTILSYKDVPTLRSRFRDVQTYRNDVMHAHNISKEIFGKARYLFDKINEELDVAIGKLIGRSEEVSTEQKPDVNTAISSALVAMNISAMTEALRGVSLSPAVLEMSSQMSKVLGDLQLPTVQPAMAEALKGLTPALSSLAITDAIKGMNAIANNPAIADAFKAIQPLKENSAIAEALRNATAFQTSPAMEGIKKQMSQFSELMRPYQQMVDALRPYSALQDSLRSIAENRPPTHAFDDDAADEPEIDNEKPEEDNPR